ncbi:hypothetical protein [Frankia sp. Cas3]|uniref:hypothetical protein n=1 Tax=Frankia sp. Cas3 TaxID=3073926 RepID=UPI002AD443F1|nr:hypothetical protein [Frankia sp. Cas3]
MAAATCYRQRIDIPGPDNQPIHIVGTDETWPEIILAIGAGRVVMDDPDQVEDVREQLSAALARAAAAINWQQADRRPTRGAQQRRERIYRRVIEAGSDPVTVESRIERGHPEVVVMVGDDRDDAVTMRGADDVAAVRRQLWTVLGRALTTVAWGVASDLLARGC